MIPEKQINPEYLPYKLPQDGRVADPFTRLAAFILRILIPFVCIVLELIFITALVMIFELDEYQALGVGIIVIGLTLLFFLILDIYLIVKRSQTLGKFLLNIVVVDDKNHQPIGWLEHIGLRIIVGKYLGIIGAVMLGSLWDIIDNLFIFSQNGRTLHDRIANTLVFNLPPKYHLKGFLGIDSLNQPIKKIYEQKGK